MNILFITRLFYPHIGGVEKHIQKVSQELINKGHNITVLTTKFEETLHEKETWNSINIIRFNQPNIKYLGLLYTWYWLIRNINKLLNSDIIHIHDVFIWYLPLFIILPFKKVFITFHGQWSKYPISKNDKFQKKLANMFTYGNICIGDYIPKHYSIKSDIISYGACAKPKKYLLEKDNKLILYVGRLDKGLTLDIFLNALKLLKGYKVIFCGDGNLRNRCMKYGDVKGFNDPQKYYKTAKYCFASGYLTILEALSNKCIVLTAPGNTLMRDYYTMTPFSRYINIFKHPKEIANYIVKNKDGYSQEGYDYAIKASWDKLSKLYLRLWEKKS